MHYSGGHFEIDQYRLKKIACLSANSEISRSSELVTKISDFCNEVNDYLIKPPYYYACSAWYSGLQNNMKHKPQILQNKTIRFALDLSPWTHLDITNFLKMQWLPVDVGVEQLNLNIMHRIVHGGAPCYLTGSFDMVSQVHDGETRHRTLSVSLPSTGRNGSKAFKLNSIKSGNKLPLKIKKPNSLAYFKQAVRLYLIDRLVSEYNSDFLYY